MKREKISEGGALVITATPETDEDRAMLARLGRACPGPPGGIPTQARVRGVLRGGRFYGRVEIDWIDPGEAMWE